jgi:sugar phosphate isomerase/epimerase
MILDQSGCSRRDFLRSASGVAASVLVVGRARVSFAYPLDGIMGVQSNDVGRLMQSDLNGTLKALADMGYKALDLVVNQSTAPDVKKALDQVGMICHNAHVNASAFDDTNWAQTVQTARLLGLKSMVYSGGAPGGGGGGRGRGPGAPAGAAVEGDAGGRSADGAPAAVAPQATADDWRKYADRVNLAGEKTKKEGLQLGWHNHGEFHPLADGKIPFELVVENTDPTLVKYQFDVGNAAAAGADPYAYLARYKDRLYSIHVKEIQDGRSGGPLGAGTMDFKRVFTLAKAANVHDYDVECGTGGDVMANLRASAEFLKNYKL